MRSADPVCLCNCCRYGSDDGKGAGWHPPRAFHMLRGEAFSWLYTLTLLDALYMVEEDLKKSSKKDLLAG